MKIISNAQSGIFMQRNNCNAQVADEKSRAECKCVIDIIRAKKVDHYQKLKSGMAFSIRAISAVGVVANYALWLQSLNFRAVVAPAAVPISIRLAKLS